MIWLRKGVRKAEMIHHDPTSFEADRALAGAGHDQASRAALAAAGIGTWRLDLASGLCSWDETGGRLFGLAPTGDSAFAPIDPDDHAALAALADGWVDGESREIEFRLCLGEGRVLRVGGCAVPSADDSGAVRSLHGVVIGDCAARASERALAESRRQLATLIGNLPGMVYRSHLQAPWALSYASEGAEAITGYPAEDWVADRVRWAEIVHQDDLPAISYEIDKAVVERRPFCLTYRIRHRSGACRWLQERGQAVYAEDGRPLYLEGFIADTTEQALLEASLREARTEALASAAKLAAALESTLDRVYSLDAELRFTYMNRRAMEPYGGADALVGRRITDVMPEIADTEFGRCYLRVLASRVHETIEAHFPPTDQWFEAHVMPSEDAGITVFYRDVTDRRRAEDALRDSNERALSILDSVPQILWSSDANGLCDYYSPQWTEFTGRSSVADGGQGWVEALHPDDRGKARGAWVASITTGRPLDLEMRLRHRSGDYRWTLARATAKRDAQGRISRWYGTCTDVHERVTAQAALQESEAITRSILDASPDCIKLLDRDGRILFVNPLGPRSAELDEDTPVIGVRWVDFLLPEAAEQAGAAVERALAGETVHFAMSHPTRTGNVKWWDIVATPVAGSQGSRVVIVSRDITHQKQSEEHVRWVANHDPLTALPNRLLFQEHLDGITAKEGRDGRFALLLFDVDDFKRINDSLGHDAGDSLLCAFAERLRIASRPEDFVARLGGDEFAVIVAGAQSEADVRTATDAILAEFRRPHVYAGRILDCSASIGASLFPNHGRTRAELLKHADIALYVAKSSWRGNLRLFQPAMRSGMQSRVSMLAVARDALKRDLVIPYYQPKIDLGSLRVAGFEALLRWNDPRRGIQTPDTIAAAFEDINTAAEISDRMIARVIDDMRRWIDDGIEFGHVAINAAAAEFRRGNFAETVLERLAAAQIPASRLQLEVTETVFLGRGADCVERALRTLSQAGVRIALDDFGTGYASLSHLKQFPVDVLKIDRSFVAELSESDDAAAIVRAVINLGRGLEMEVVAEGIETESQALWLTDKGCHTGQGHLYAAAAPAGEVRAILARFNGGLRAA